MELRNPQRPALLVDDEQEALESEAMVLAVAGLTNVRTCADSREVLPLLADTPCSVVVLDITMPHIDGIELLERIGADHPHTVAIMLTGLNDIEAAVNCVKKGAFDYIVKPIDGERLTTAVARALEHYDLLDETRRLREGFLTDSLRAPDVFKPIATSDPRMLSIFRYIEAIAPTNLPILLTGETGVGKELLARTIHDASGADGEFVTVNCAGIDDQLFSDTLFGHVKDAYTGASGSRQGLIARAAGGTIFLDEIGDLRPETQVKLLRLLQEGTYYPLGSDTPAVADTRFVAATNVDLKKATDGGSFRKDLYYRLQSHEVHVPPLRDRRGDLPALLDVFLAQASDEMSKSKPTPPPELITLLKNYAFPGNIRELRGMVFDAVGRHTGGVLSCGSFEQAVGKHAEPVSPAQSAELSGEELVLFPGQLPTVAEVECALVAEALKRTEGNKTLAAKLVGMARQTFRTKAKKIGL